MISKIHNFKITCSIHLFQRRGRGREDGGKNSSHRDAVDGGEERIDSRRKRGNRSKETSRKRLGTKKTTSLQIYDVDPRLKNDTTATATARVIV